MISDAERAALLAFVDKEVPPGSVAVYLTGSPPDLIKFYQECVAVVNGSSEPIGATRH